jgi:hypothetical protein
MPTCTWLWCSMPTTGSWQANVVALVTAALYCDRISVALEMSWCQQAADSTGGSAPDLSRIRLSSLAPASLDVPLGGCLACMPTQHLDAFNRLAGKPHVGGTLPL